MSHHVTPSVSTHIPVTIEELPNESDELSVGRPDAPTPSLWQRAVKVRHRVTGKPAVVHRVDWSMNQFRAYYPDERSPDGTIGRFAERTEWEQCAAWDVEVTFSPRELERQATAMRLQEEISLLDEASMAAAAVLCDDTDPVKALAKLEALRKLGVIKSRSAEAVQVAAKAAKK